jgi:2-oxoglutarate dehydrogenase E1 component
MYMSDINGRSAGLQSRLESIRGTPRFSSNMKKRVLERLTAAETLERYLHTRYVGQKRFSLEGGESLIVRWTKLIRCRQPRCRRKSWSAWRTVVV